MKVYHVEANEMELAKGVEERNKDNFRDQQNFLQGEFKKIVTVTLRQDLGSKSVVPTVRYNFKSKIYMDEKEHHNSTILVVRCEPNDATLRDHIGNTNSEGVKSLHPKNIDIIKQCNLPIVLYNSSLQIHRPELKATVKYSMETKELDVYFCSSVPIKVLIYTAMCFDKGTASEMLSAHYAIRLNKCIEKIANYEKKLMEIKALTKTYEQQVRDNEVLCKEVGEQLVNAELDLIAKTDVFRQHADKVRWEIDQAKSNMNEQSAAEEATIIKNIGQIFDVNKLDNKLVQRCSRHAQQGQQILTDLSNCARNVAQLASLHCPSESP